MTLYGWFQGTGPSGYGYNSTAEEVTEDLDLSGETILVTGANSGLGRETARVLTLRGAAVLAAARTSEKAERTCEELPGPAEPVVCELSEPDSVRSCVDEVQEYGEPLDAIVANAGIMALAELEQKYGYEMQFLTNHIGHFILVTGLIDALADDGRVVMLSSAAHERTPEGGIDFDNLSGDRGYDPWEFYGQSKLANLLVAKELARRFEEDSSHDRVANAVHPGVIDTNLARNIQPLFKWIFRGISVLAQPVAMKSVAQGAATQTWAAVHPDAGDYNGEYFSHCNVAEPSRHARDPELAERLWEETEQMVEAL